MSPDAHYDLSSLLLATFFILEFFYYKKMIPVWLPVLFQVICGVLLCGSSLLENWTFAAFALSSILGLSLALASFPSLGCKSALLEKLFRFPIDNKLAFQLVSHYSVHALSEELFWRGAMTSLLGRSPFVIILISALFSLAHIPKLTDSTSYFEMLTTSIVLHIFYLQSGSILATSLLHAVRNIVLVLFAKDKHHGKTEK